jgi:hypothetical protein
MLSLRSEWAAGHRLAFGILCIGLLFLNLPLCLTPILNRVTIAASLAFMSLLQFGVH